MDPTVSNLLSGLIGAIVGAAVVILWERSESRRHERGAGIAIEYEMIANATHLSTTAKQGEAWGATSDATWRAFAPIVAAALSPAEFNAVGQGYLYLAVAEDMRLQLKSGVAMSDDTREALTTVEEAFRDGARILRAKYVKGGKSSPPNN